MRLTMLPLRPLQSLPSVVRRMRPAFRRTTTILSAALVASLPLAPALALDESLLQAVRYDYTVSRGGSKVGDGIISLKEDEKPGCYLYSQVAKPTVFWLKLMSSDVVEQSWFCLNEAHDPVPTVYRYHRDGLGSGSETFSITFDWANMKALNERGEHYDIEDGTVDRLLMQLVLRNWIISAVKETGKLPDGEQRVLFADQDKLEDYVFEIRAEAAVKVPAGTFDTIRLDRTDSTHRRTQFWLAPELNYAVVKAEQQRNDDPVVRLVLEKLPK